MKNRIEREAEVPECTSCGTCCFSELPEYVRVFGVDFDRMDARAQSFTHFIGNRCFMRIENGRCAALMVDPLEKRFLCSIYPMRPDVCHSLDRGTGACRGEIFSKGHRPIEALIEAEALLKKRRDI